MSVGTLYQTTTPADGVTDFLSRLLDPAGAYGEGLYWTGTGTVGSSYPPFLALVRDDSGRVWPCGAISTTAITFADGDGTRGLYLVPFDDTDEPTYLVGQIGSFSLVSAASAPADALLLGSGTVASGAYTSFTEQSGVRHDSLSVGSGKDDDLYLYARNGDTNQPALRYQATGSVWQVSNDGTTWAALASRAASATNGDVASLDGSGNLTDAGFAASDVARLSVANTFTLAQTVSATSNQLVLGATRTVTLHAPTPATASRTHTVPDISGNGTFAFLEGTQTFAGAKTFSAAVAVTATSNQLVLSGPTRTVTLTAAQPANFSRTHTIPDIAGDGTFAFLEGTQTFAGAKTFSAAVAVTATSNQLVLSGPTRTVTLTAAQPASSSRTHTIPDIAGNGTFAFLEGTQTFSGAKTFTGGVTLSGSVGNMLYVNFATSNTAANAALVLSKPAWTSSGTGGDVAIDARVYPTLSAGVTLSSRATGINFQATRGAVANGGDAGTYGSMAAAVYTYGHIGTDSVANPVTTNLYGTMYNPAFTRGTVTNWYDHYIPSITTLSTSGWSANHGFTVGTVVRPTTTNGFYYVCTTAGTSAGSEPTWVTGAGNTTTDNTAVWTAIVIPAITNRYQIYLASSISATNNYQIYLSGGTGSSTIYPIYFAGTSSTGTDNAIWWGTTTKLYSDTASSLKTDTQFKVGGNLTVSGSATLSGGTTLSGSTVLASSPPASSSAAGAVGQIACDTSYIYVCTGATTWKRVALATY